MTSMEFCGICRGGPWDGTELTSDVRSWAVEKPRPVPLSAAVANWKPRHGHYVWYHPNIWKWHP